MFLSRLLGKEAIDIAFNMGLGKICGQPVDFDRQARRQSRSSSCILRNNFYGKPVVLETEPGIDFVGSAIEVRGLRLQATYIERQRIFICYF